MSRTMLAAMATMMAAGAAQGAVETHEIWFSNRMPTIGGQSSFQCDIPLFDTQSGSRILTGMTLRGDVKIDARVALANFINENMPASGQIIAGFDFSPPGADIHVHSAADYQTLLTPGGVGYQAPQVDCSFDPVAVADPLQYASLGEAQISATISFDAEVTGPQEATTWWHVYENPKIHGVMTIEYTYSQVPSAGSGMVLLGGMTMAARRRRR